MSLRLNSFLAASQELRQLAGKAKQLLLLQQHYELALPATLRRASHIMQCERRILTIAADNGAVAAKLRQMTPDLLKTLQEFGHDVTVIQVRVQVSTPPQIPAVAKPALSSSGKQQLSELAETLPDSPLRRALLELARLGKS